MDRTDLRILAELQADGTLSSQALAEKVGLSTAPTWRRVKKLEEDRVIATTVAILDPEKIGLDVIAVAAVSLEDHHPDSVREFDDMVANRPEILECYAMSGQYDYLLKVVCSSIKAYERLLREHIMPCKAVHQVNTSFVLRKQKATTALPLGEVELKA
jgi:Lrp/AsnC family leucine-responsive transcriptional regulator